MTWPDVHYKKLTVPAWTPCKDCDGRGELVIQFPSADGIEDCPICNGDGGKWNEAVIWNSIESFSHIIIDGKEKFVRKSSILYQLYDPCGECGGDGRCIIKKSVGCAHTSEILRCHQSNGSICIIDEICPHCLQGSDGPTGAAEGTGQGWKIEE